MTKSSSQRLAVAAVILLTGTLALSFGQAASGQWEGHDSSASILEGTWRVEIRQSNCATGVEGSPFRSFLTFAPGGTLTGTTANPAFLPGQRSPDHGIWSHKRGHDYFALSEAFLLFDSDAHPPFPGFRAGTQRISQEIELKNHNEFTSATVVEFFDVNGNSVLTGCANAVGRRFE
jgi:hypothetical protein